MAGRAEIGKLRVREDLPIRAAKIDGSIDVVRDRSLRLRNIKRKLKACRVGKGEGRDA